MGVPIDPVVPPLRAVTRPLAGTPDLVALTDPQDPLVWIRGDRGCVGIGETLRLAFTGPDRFTEAANTWRAIANNAQIDDPVQMPGTGLVALGTFAFADHSEAESVLIVPPILVAQHRKAAWITEITEITNSTQAAEASSQEAPAIPTPKPQEPWHAITFEAAPDTVKKYLEGVRRAAETIDKGEAEKIAS